MATDWSNIRDHGGGRVGPAYSRVSGGMGAPCVHAGGLVANSQTTGSWVAELRPGRAQHWVTATAAPCTSLFKPVVVDDPLDLGKEPADVYDEATLWWRHERFHRLVMRDPERAHALFAGERDALEAGWLAEPPEPANPTRSSCALTRCRCCWPSSPSRCCWCHGLSLEHRSTSTGSRPPQTQVTAATHCNNMTTS